MNRINIEQLFYWNNTVRKCIIPLKSKAPEWQSYFVAMSVMGHFSGLAWVEKHIMDKRSSIDYLRTDPSSDPDRILHLMRVTELGEMLVNLQDVPNIHEKIYSLQNIGNPKYGQIENIVAELMAAKILYMYNYSFRFVPISGLKKSDYDLEFILNNQRICCEVKCKLEQTELTNEKTIIDTLKKASTQLPQEKPSIIIVSVPQSWTKDTIKYQKLEKAASRFYGQNEKIISILFYSEHIFNDGYLTHKLIVTKEYPNLKSKFGEYPLIFSHNINGALNNWLFFSNLTSIEQTMRRTHFLIF